MAVVDELSDEVIAVFDEHHPEVVRGDAGDVWFDCASVDCSVGELDSAQEFLKHQEHMLMQAGLLV